MANNRKRLQGRVVSDKMDKTVVVEIERSKRHRIYEKTLISTKKVMAHDESNEIPMGAIVRIVESKPLSKKKRWVVEEVLVDPGNRVVTSVSDEQEVLQTEQIGMEDDETPASGVVETVTDAAATAVDTASAVIKDAAETVSDMVDAVVEDDDEGKEA